MEAENRLQKLIATIDPNASVEFVSIGFELMSTNVDLKTTHLSYASQVVAYGLQKQVTLKVLYY